MIKKESKQLFIGGSSNLDLLNNNTNKSIICENNICKPENEPPKEISDPDFFPPLPKVPDKKIFTQPDIFTKDRPKLKFDIPSEEHYEPNTKDYTVYGGPFLPRTTITPSMSAPVLGIPFEIYTRLPPDLQTT